MEQLENFGVEQVTSLLGRIPNAGNFSGDITKSVFIALPKGKNGSDRM